MSSDYKNGITTSLRGRRIGLQRLSTNATGGTRGEFDFLVGPESLRAHTSTSDSTDTNLHPFGVSYLASGTSSVYTIDPPIPGVSKVVVSSTSGPAYVKTANSETFITTSTVGSSNTTVKISSLGGSIQLVGVTTAVWALFLGGSTGMFTLTTST